MYIREKTTQIKMCASNKTNKSAYGLAAKQIGPCDMNRHD